MKLIATESGQVLQLLVMEEIRPSSGFYAPKFFRAAHERYEFVSGPSDMEKAILDGAKFKNGHLSAGRQDIAISEMGLFNDGLLVTCSNTDNAEIVTDDLMQWASQEFRLKDRQTLIPRRYASSVVVDFAVSIDRALRGYEFISDVLSDAMAPYTEKRHPMQVSRVALMVDALTLPPHFNTQFLLERRAGVPFTANRYYSVAQLKTQAHLSVLEKIEKAMASQETTGALSQARSTSKAGH